MFDALSTAFLWIYAVLGAVATIWSLFRKETIVDFVKQPKRRKIILKALPWLVAVICFLSVWLVAWGRREIRLLEERLIAVNSPALIRNRKMRLDEIRTLKPRWKNVLVATQDELSKQVIADRIVFLTDVPFGPNTGVQIEGRRFVDCLIIGPAVMGITGPSGFLSCGWIGPGLDGFKSVRFELADPKGRYQGLVGIQSTTFERCQFYHVGVAGPKDFLDFIEEQIEVRQVSTE